MTILQDISKIPRKHRNGLGSVKTITSVYIAPVTLDATRAIAKQHNVSISGVIELALYRLLADMEAAKRNIHILQHTETITHRSL